MESLFNFLTIVVAVGVLLNAYLCSRLKKYIKSPAWGLQQLAWVFILASQAGGLVNVNAFSPASNKLTLLNTVCRLTGVGLFAASYITKEITFKKVLKKVTAFYLEARQKDTDVV